MLPSGQRPGWYVLVQTGMYPLWHTHLLEPDVRAAIKSKAVTGFSGFWQTNGSIMPKGPSLLISPSLERQRGMPPFLQPSKVSSFSSPLGHWHLLKKMNQMHSLLILDVVVGNYIRGSAFSENVFEIPESDVCPVIREDQSLHWSTYFANTRLCLLI